MRTFKTVVFLAAVFFFAACDPENNDIIPRSIEYVVSRHDVPNVTTSVEVRSDKEYYALLDSFCDFTMQGKFVTFHGSKKSGPGSKQATTFSTTNREEMKRWMARMEDEGRTVTVTYNSSTGTWTGMAYTNTTNGTVGQERRLSRVTMDVVGIPNAFEYHTVYTYFWNGDQLTNVDMVEEKYDRFMNNGAMVDSIYYKHNTATLVYSNNLRTEVVFFDAGGDVLENILYSYQNGRLVQEQRSTNTYSYVYNGDGYIESWTISPGYNTALPCGLHCEWVNGDMVHTIYPSGVSGDSLEYDNSLHPYGVTLGTTTLLPGYDRYIPQETQWSRHNLTRRFAVTGKSEGSELRITYTYDGDGYPVAAETSWYDYSIIHWTFEYND